MSGYNFFLLLDLISTKTSRLVWMWRWKKRNHQKTQKGRGLVTELITISLNVPKTFANIHFISLNYGIWIVHKTCWFECIETVCMIFGICDWFQTNSLDWKTFLISINNIKSSDFVGKGGGGVAKNSPI